MLFLRGNGQFCSSFVLVVYLFVTNGCQETKGFRTCKEPDIDNGRIFRGQKKTYYTGDVITFLCDNVYNVIGEGTIKCMPDGTWSNNPPFCIEIVCHQLQKVQHGTITPNPKTSKICSTVKVSCDEGYELVGMNEMQCTIDGTWIPEWMPYCTEIVCHQLQKVQHGTITPNPKTSKICSTVKVSCDEGYELVGMNEMQCTIDGTWTPEWMPYCTDVRNDRGREDGSCQHKVEQLKMENQRLTEMNEEQQKQIVQYFCYAFCYYRYFLNNNTIQECEDNLESLSKCISCTIRPTCNGCV